MIFTAHRLSTNIYKMKNASKRAKGIRRWACTDTSGEDDKLIVEQPPIPFLSKFKFREFSLLNMDNNMISNQ